MTPEQQFFIQILSDHIHNRTSVPPDEIDWEILVNYAEEQSLTGLIYLQLRDFFQKNPQTAPDAAKRLHQGFYSDVYLAVNRSAEIDTVVRQLADVPIVLMKGYAIQQYYPVPELRTMGDIDLVIHTEDRERTDAVMLAEGYRKMVDNHAVWTYQKRGICFEIHDHMFYEYLANQIDYRGYFDQLWKHVHQFNGAKKLYIPEEDFHFLYLLTHCAKHIINGGIGFRAFLDLACMVKKSGHTMDWKWIKAQLKELKLLQFAKTCLALCQTWFDVASPIQTTALDSVFYSGVVEKMFADGTFGLENEQNEGAHTAKEIKRSKNGYLFAALKLTMYKLFPPYQEMQLIQWYRFLDGKPWLLPAAWVYRWFYVIRHKFKESKKLLIEPYHMRQTIEEREKLISSWGL